MAPDLTDRRPTNRAMVSCGSRYRVRAGTGAAPAALATMTSVGGVFLLAVDRQEELLERWLTAQQRLRMRGSEHGQQVVDGPSYLAAELVAGDGDRADPWHPVDDRRRAGEGCLHGEGRQVAHLGERADLYQPAAAQDRDAVAERLGFGQDVR